MPIRTVLVAEDFSPFRQFVCDQLAERPDISVVPVADGLAAIRAAEELQPDLALLDIGLPMLNGIAAAKDIRTTCPRAKVVFLTQESSPDIVDAARELGAHGYIHKTRARYLMSIVDAVLAEAPVTSESATHPHKGPHQHEAHLFADDSALVDSAERFVLGRLATRDAAIVALTRSHLEALEARLRRRQAVIAPAREQGTFVTLDADDVLSVVARGASADLCAIKAGWKRVIATAGAATGLPRPRVAAFSEIAPHVLAAGHTDAAMTLEQMGEDLCQAPDLPRLDIVCVYTALPSNDEFRRLYTTHSLVTVR